MIDIETMYHMVGVIEGIACGLDDKFSGPLNDALAVICDILENRRWRSYASGNDKHTP